MVEEGVEYGVAGSGEGEAVGAFGEAAGVWIVVESGLDGHLAVGVGAVILRAADDGVVVEGVDLHGLYLHSFQRAAIVVLHVEGHQLTADDRVAVPVAPTGTYRHCHQGDSQECYSFLCHSNLYLNRRRAVR